MGTVYQFCNQIYGLNLLSTGITNVPKETIVWSHITVKKLIFL